MGNWGTFGVGILLLPMVCTAGETINFNRDVRPILSDRCFHCHGPNEHDRQAELRLDQADGPEGAYRELYGTHAIQPGSLENSELWRRINAGDDEVMPPPDSPKKPLTDEEKSTISRWIGEGAEYAPFWSFTRPQNPPIPDVRHGDWSQQPIDRFVLRRLEQEGLMPKPAADRRTLIRRLSLDLTGLPPTREEIQRFLKDTSSDAHEKQIDRLLASPHYGEHMTKYWLDLARFADTNGIHHDHYRDMTPYRDWVIRAFNRNLPYDRFARDQLAGDLYVQPTRDQLVASGFNRLHLIIDRGTALPEESYTRNVVDRVTAVGTAFLGLTVQCAVCHDHKYDPITTRDFYQLFAFFNNLDAEPETGGRQGPDFEQGLQPPYIRLTTDEQEIELADFDRRIREMTTRIRQTERDSGKVGDGERERILAAKLKEAKETLAQLRKQKQAYEATIPAAMVMKERADIRPARILIRGQYDNPGEVVERNTPGFLPPIKESGKPKTRIDLAEWLVAPENPLTARVAVNRFWQQFFGVGLVKTSEDFGAQGEWPSHPELLDYLAVSFIESGWDVKALVKQIVMSETYKQSSVTDTAEYEDDPENRLLARGPRFRMDSEMIRDQVLATSGLLNPEMFGKSVKPPQPPGLWAAVNMPHSYPRVYEPDSGDRIYRRSLYTFWKRGMPPPQMTILNAPSREACVARRERTNTPLQALLLMNETECLKAARHLARKTITDRSASPKDWVATLYETITAKLPDADESDSLLKMVEDLESIYGNNDELASNLCDGAQLPEGTTSAELAAWTMVASTIYNLDITKTLD